MSYPPYQAFDAETTGATNGSYGNPFHADNRLCVVGYGNSGGIGVANLLDVRNPSTPILEEFGRAYTDPNILSVGFNWKFDAHWSRRYGLVFPKQGNVWDCQLAHFIIHDQQTPLPSLEDCANYYGIGEKFLDIEVEYWKKGIDNDQVPSEILYKRVQTDVNITAKLFEVQLDYLRQNPSKKRLIWVSCQDQKVLQEMEWNGLKYDIALSMSLGKNDLKEIEKIDDEINQIVNAF